MERIRCLPAMRGGIRQGINDFELLDDRARPSMGDNEWQSILMSGADMNKVNVQPIDLGDEVRQRIELCLDLPPVVVFCPIVCESLSRRELHALRGIRDRLTVWPASRVDAAAQFGQFSFRKIDVKRTDGGLFTARLDSG